MLEFIYSSRVHTIVRLLSHHMRSLAVTLKSSLGVTLRRTCRTLGVDLQWPCYWKCAKFHNLCSDSKSKQINKKEINLIPSESKTFRVQNCKILMTLCRIIPLKIQITVRLAWQLLQNDYFKYWNNMQNKPEMVGFMSFFKEKESKGTWCLQNPLINSGQSNPPELSLI
jgi:hypothetical protein